MRALISALLFLQSTLSFAGKELPQAKWEITQGLREPESVYFDSATETYFVSNVAGDAKRSDGDGWISRYDARGKLIQDRWVSGMNAPKGMRATGGVLWVSDIQTLYKIDLKTGAILSRILMGGARFLNDVALGPEGEVYVSDTLGGKIFEYRDSKVSIFAQGNELESPNGLLVRGDKLYVAAWGFTADFTNTTAGRLYSIDLKTKEMSAVTSEPLGNLDGLEWDGKGFLVSDWVAGKVYRVSKEGKAETLFEGLKGPADLFWNGEQQTVVIPRMAENRVSAFTVKSDAN